MREMTLSVIIPAFNEEKNIANTIDNVIAAIRGHFTEYEILVFDDHSTDSTGTIADELAKSNISVKVVHNFTNMGFAFNYKEGLRLAKYQYVGMIPGDNEISDKSIKEIFDCIGKADIVIPYTVNSNIRLCPDR